MRDRLPLLARHVEIGAQRPPDIPGLDAVLDGLRGRAPVHPGQDVVHEQRRATHRTELPFDEFVEFGQSHENNLPSRFMAHPNRIGHLGNPRAARWAASR